MASEAIRSKWPGELADAGFIPVARSFLRNYARLSPPLNEFEVILIIDLVDYVWSQKPAFPSWELLAVDLGTTVARISEALHSLREKGYLDFVMLDGGGQAYMLTGLYEKLDELIASHHGWRPTPRQAGHTATN